MSNSSNVTIRSIVDRPLIYDEVDTNFQELIFVIDEHNAHVADAEAHDAASITYDATASGLASGKVQGAIDEIDQTLDDHIASTTAHDAADVTFDPSTSNLASDNVQQATEEVQTNLETHINDVDPHSQYTTDEESTEIAVNNSITFAIALG